MLQLDIILEKSTVLFEEFLQTEKVISAAG
jgi:hypothetical protein